MSNVSAAFLIDIPPCTSLMAASMLSGFHCLLTLALTILGIFIVAQGGVVWRHLLHTLKSATGVTKFWGPPKFRDPHPHIMGILLKF